MPLPAKLRKWLEQPGSVLSSEERDFIGCVEECADCGVGYGFMQQIVEWLWQEYAEKAGLPGSAWGPEYFNARIAELETKIARLEAEHHAQAQRTD